MRTGDYTAGVDGTTAQTVPVRDESQGVSAGVPAAATVTIADNDTAGVTVVPDESVVVGRRGRHGHLHGGVG